VIVKQSRDIQRLTEAGKVAAEVMAEMAKSVRPGIATGKLDRIAETMIRRYGAESAPRYFYKFPGTTCISILPVVAHGIPGNYRIRPGDVVNIDVSVFLEGFCADTGMTIAVEPQTDLVKEVCRTASGALAEVIGMIRPGLPVSEIGKTVQTKARRHGLTVIKNLCGHGLGPTLHEDPETILNFYSRREKRRFSEGQVVAIEPFISSEGEYVREQKDGWGLAVSGGSLAAQYEHTLILMKNETIITTKRA
jgi:methionyl aminopeptidase